MQIQSFKSFLLVFPVKKYKTHAKLKVETTNFLFFRSSLNIIRNFLQKYVLIKFFWYAAALDMNAKQKTRGLVFFGLKYSALTRAHCSKKKRFLQLRFFSF